MKGEMGDWFKGINGKFVFVIKIIFYISLVGVRGERGFPGLPGLPGGMGLRGMVNNISYVLKKSINYKSLFLLEWFARWRWNTRTTWSWWISR
jgi:hypothetical protein